MGVATASEQRWGAHNPLNTGIHTLGCSWCSWDSFCSGGPGFLVSAPMAMAMPSLGRRRSCLTRKWTVSHGESSGSARTQLADPQRHRSCVWTGKWDCGNQGCTSMDVELSAMFHCPEGLDMLIPAEPHKAHPHKQPRETRHPPLR